MPFVSQKQEKYMFANHPGIADKMAHNSGQTGGGTKKSVAAYHSLPASAKSGKSGSKSGTNNGSKRAAPVVHKIPTSTGNHKAMMAKARATRRAPAKRGK